MPESFDVIVVGGGCNGTGIARDCAMRGLKVLLLEKNDFASGTTGASSGMIHGGPRYLLSEVKTTRLSSQDAGYIRQMAPHLCFRIPFLYPVVKGDHSTLSRKIRLSLVETFFQAYDKYSALKGGKKHTRLSREEALQLEPALTSDTVGAVTFDEWGINTERLCVANALAAKNGGASVKNHTEVKRIIKEEQRIVGVVTLNRLTFEETEYRCKILFNAAGPWAPRLAQMAGVEVKLRPAKGIHLVLDRRITNIAVVSQCIDGREIFINPHENSTLLGTTDDDYYGDPDDIPVTEDEVEYLLQGMERSYPEIRKARILTTTRGLRPTLYQEGVSEDAMSRNHRVFDHEKENGVPGFLSIAGGKLASFRQMAEEATDLVCKKLGTPSLCTTHLVPLPGGDKVPEADEIARTYRIHPYVAERLVCRHGSLTHEILQPTLAKAEDKAILCPCEPVTAAEVRYAVGEEWACTLGDIKRRTHLGAGSCQGMQCLIGALGLLCQEKAERHQVPPEDPVAELKDFVQESWSHRSPVVRGIGLAQEEMIQMVFQGVLDLGNV